ncbi:YggS family pyridoxal phosphate-dependent enzyme [Actinomyces wuliandei]|uniref:YggS family pyridoxal phosphate-dependent enzyme n=1 Tax=Actinomyces wuliandei TaxID=2057743 RepID=UPI000FD9FEF1|nr:YggS family pyridoxal phosphate-dependent enzyme [Actinomyces wuliandei]
MTSSPVPTGVPDEAGDGTGSVPIGDSTLVSGTGSAGTDTAASVEELRRRLAAVRARIDAAAWRAGRDPAEIRLLPVSKTVPEERLRAAYAAGATQMGENKVQETRRKAGNLADLGIAWVLIGHVQTNKARDAAAVADELQSLDSLRLAQALDRRLQASGRSLDVYVQVNSSGEASKSGLEPTEVPGFLAQLQAYPTLRVQGLMTLAAHTTDQARVRECFRLVRQLRDEAAQAGTVGPGLLSMGMSGDLETAVEEGSTCVRVGQAIFGARPTPMSATRTGTRTSTPEA